MIASIGDIAAGVDALNVRYQLKRLCLNVMGSTRAFFKSGILCAPRDSYTNEPQKRSASDLEASMKHTHAIYQLLIILLSIIYNI
jgi:hypothetical protein